MARWYWSVRGGRFMRRSVALEIGAKGYYDDATTGHGGGGGAMSGEIDQIAIYPYPLTAAQVANHYTVAQSPCSDISGATNQQYTLASTDIGTQTRVKVTATDTQGNSATATSPATYLSAVSASNGLEPLDQAQVQTTTPALTYTITPTPPSGTQYEFEISKSQNFSGYVKTSAWTADASTFSVPSGWLDNKTSYWWHVRTKTPSGVVSAWQGPNELTVQLAPSGAPSDWAMWKSGPLAVNLANGNLVFNAPTPSFPTATGTMSASVVFNSLDPQNEDEFVKGWIVNGGNDFAPPPKLIDYGALGGEDAVVATWPDGQVSVFNHISNSSIYKSPPGDDSQLTTDGGSPPGKYTLVDAGGDTFVYGAADTTTGVASIQSSEIVDAQPGKAKLTYTLDNYRRITQIADDTGRTLTFSWPSTTCTTCVLTVTGPDGQAWKYTDTGGEITGINDGTRTLYQLTYTNGELTKIQNADDLTANSQHAVTIAYDGDGRVSEIDNGPITNQIPSVSRTTFAYRSGGTTAPARHDHHIPAPGYPWDPGYNAGTTLTAGSTRTAAGYTVVTPPKLQGTGNGVTTYYDSLDHPMETIDAMNRVTQMQYDAKDQLLWTEDPDGNPTDKTYDPVTDQLLSTTAPDPDGSGPLARPVTQDRYDETAVGTATAAGQAKQGLQGAYFTNIHLSGRATGLRTDASVNFDWGAGGPAILPGTSSNYSVRWTGLLDVPETGSYTLMTYATDGTRLTIDDRQVLNNWKTQPLVLTNSQPISLTSGRHRITLDYYVTTDTARVQLKWRCAACNSPIPAEIVPSADLLPNWGNLTSTVDPVGRISFSHFLNPQLGHPDYVLADTDSSSSDVSPADDPTTSFAYDAYGRVTKKVMPKGNAGRLFDAKGNLSGSADNRYATTYTYYAAADPASPPQPCSGSSVNQAEQLKTEQQYGLAATSYVYDAAGRTAAVTRGDGTTCFSYDSEGRLTSEQAPSDTQPTMFAYDASGNQLSVTEGSQTLTSQYDEAGRVTSTTDSFGSTAAFTYDADGNVSTRTITLVSGGTPYTTRYNTYDAADELTAETDAASKPWQFFYDSRGNLQATQYPNGTFSWADTNADGWTTDVYNRHGSLSAPLPSSAPSDTSPLADFTYQYNDAGQKTQEARTDASGTQTTSFLYDQLGRLTQATLPTGTVREYSYDLDSNRTQIADNGTVTSSYTYDPAATPGVDQLTSAGTTTYSYTSDGQVSTYGANVLTWDGWQRLAGGTFGGTTVTYGYDPAGALRTRIASGVTTEYHLGDLVETDGTGTVTTSYIDGPAGDPAQYAGAPGSGGATYLYYNAHGDLAAETDANGTRTALHTYDPFGAPTDTPPANSTVHRYTGKWDKQYDTTSALVLMGARPYDPNLGRFLAVDPVDGGSPNNYDYAGQDPVNGYDLTGRTHDEDVVTDTGNYLFTTCVRQGGATICSDEWILDNGSDSSAIVTDTRQTTRRNGEVVYRGIAPGETHYERDPSGTNWQGDNVHIDLADLLSKAPACFAGGELGAFYGSFGLLPGSTVAGAVAGCAFGVLMDESGGGGNVPDAPHSE